MESLKRTGTEKLKSIQINLPPHVTIKQESRAVARKPQECLSVCRSRACEAYTKRIKAKIKDD